MSYAARSSTQGCERVTAPSSPRQAGCSHPSAETAFLRRYYVLFFIEIQTLRVHLAVIETLALGRKGEARLVVFIEHGRLAVHVEWGGAAHSCSASVRNECKRSL